MASADRQSCAAVPLPLWHFAQTAARHDSFAGGNPPTTPGHHVRSTSAANPLPLPSSPFRYGPRQSSWARTA